ncbi:hypothetical protein FHR99_000262 [Litorivivens lipolytica]|uniref:Uncharacterized protein n=1 Tax=Litorivivens lipolytica TaxID=1524264 RepID=A0A7W4W273_9GAMM|nr:hypothetical protein [Litorivivens lipolytica]
MRREARDYNREMAGMRVLNYVPDMCALNCLIGGFLID